MACKQLIQGHDVSCLTDNTRKYYQQIVLVNIDDLNQVAYDVNDVNHAVVFNLVSGATGYLYRGNENSNLYSASFSKNTTKGQPVYSHSVNLPVIGVGIQTKLVLKQLDLANYFAAIQFRDGTIELYGFENGLTTSDYTFDAQNGLGGIGLTLESKYDEDEVPYIYLGGSDNFDDLFQNIPDLIGGDFNSDFSNDFYILEI